MSDKDKEKDIYDLGFNRFLHKGDDMPPANFTSLHRAEQDVHKKKVKLENILKQKNLPKSIYLVTNSIVANDTIFLVLDGRFEIPTRFSAKRQDGEDTCIKKLHNIAYFVDAPDKKVLYDKRLADNINNGLFNKSQIANYMRTNKLDKPTLVQKSKNGTLVLKNEVPVKTILVNKLPSQYHSLYLDKTK